MTLLLPRFLPRPEVFTGGAGDDAGGEGEAELCMRRADIMGSKESSSGRENSFRKKGCAERFAVGEGEPVTCGVDWLEPGDS